MGFYSQPAISLKLTRTIFLLIILVELISFLGYFYPWLSTAFFFLLLGLVLILSLIRLEYGLYILLIELFIGSKGYLFHFDFAGISVSLRIGIFLILIGIWLYKLIYGHFKLNFIRSTFFIFYFLFFIFLIWGVIRGLLSKNSFDNLFFDTNGWLYFALVFIFFDLIVSKEVIKSIFNLFLASVSFLTFKTIILFYLFSHQVDWLTTPLYRWIRSNGLGEITKLTPFFSRVFFQSQIYLLVGFFLILVFWLNKKIDWKKVEILRPVLYLSCLLTALLTSFSRSYLFGLSIGLIGLFFVLKIFQRLSWSKIFSLIGLIILIFIFAFDFIYLLSIFPSQIGQDFSGLISQRFKFNQEPAALSRWQQLGPLWQAIKQRPFFGSGFGTTITYQSQDPRAISNYGGRYTTYAFEWGYLDIILKIGLIGLIVYFLLIGKIFYSGWKLLKKSFNHQPLDFYSSLTFGLLLGLIAILFTSITSPYLNHPLGIGYLILCSAIFEKLKEPD